MQDKSLLTKKEIYDRDFYKKNYVNVAVRFHKVHDADIIKYLKKEKNKSGLIKKLIRSYISKQ